MGSDFDFSTYAGIVKDVTLEELRGARDASSIRGAMVRLVSLPEETLTENIDGRGREHIACRAGCGTCCMVNVSVLFPEAIAIVSHVQKEFSGEELIELKKRVDQLYAGSRWLDDEERLFLRRPCAFLNEANACAIHLVRPFLCRSVTSTDPDACLEAIALPALGEWKPVMMNLFQKSLLNATYEGLAEGLAEMGLDSRGVRLTEAVKALLDKPELAEAFGAGRRIEL
jgi:Fe-S-cluster containining protein